MKAEQALRDHLANLRKANATPCNCRTSEERAKCAVSRLALTYAAKLLAWVLGDDEEYGEAVESLAYELKDLP